MKHYSRLMPYFKIITFDYRGYGDSTFAELHENGLVQDSLQLFKWAKARTNSTIFIWGDALGAAIAAHTIAELKKENLYPCGVILENPFTSMGEELGYSWFVAKMAWYMPWYTTTFINSLEESDLSFNTDKYLNQIDCPVIFWEWNFNRAKKFQINDTYDYGRDSFEASSHLIHRHETYRYEQNRYVFNNHDRFLRSFVKAGGRYCKGK